MGTSSSMIWFTRLGPFGCFIHAITFFWAELEKEEVLLNSFPPACQGLECNASMLVSLESLWGILESERVTTRKDVSNNQVQYSHFTAGERETLRERKPLAWGHRVIGHWKNQPVSLSTSPSTATFPCLLRNSHYTSIARDMCVPNSALLVRVQQRPFWLGARGGLNECYVWHLPISMI